MKPIPSPLNIVDFAVMDLQYKFIPSIENSEPNFKKIFEDYEIDIDFNMHSNNYVHVFIKAEINFGKKQLPGYSISAEVACIFEFNEEIKISEEEKNSIEGFSTIYIALNSLRGFISQLTANGPIGRYIFPSIDLNDLINKKKALINKSNITKKKALSRKTK